MAGRYAENTTVTTDRSILEIKRVLSQYLCNGFAFGEEDGRQMIGFKLSGRAVQIEIPTPAPDAPEFTQTPTGRERANYAAREAWEQEVRRRWRVFVIAIKAKLELIAAGVSTVDREFLADLLLPDGTTVSSRLIPELDRALERGKLPALLPAVTTE